jgi:hypothetical protein
MPAKTACRNMALPTGPILKSEVAKANIYTQFIITELLPFKI